MSGNPPTTLQTTSWPTIAKDARALAESDDAAATAKITAALNLPGKIKELESTVKTVKDPNIDWLLARYED
jgi:hypothetical protein